MLPKRKARIDCFFLIFQHAGGESPLTIRDWKAGENRYTIGFTRFVTAIYDRPMNNRSIEPGEPSGVITAAGLLISYCQRRLAAYKKKEEGFRLPLSVCIDYSM